MQRAPWPMPLLRQSVRLAFTRKFRASGRAGSTPETSLRGALFAALVGTGCRLHGVCAGTRQGHPCQKQSTCSVGWLYQHHCPYQRRDHASPLALHVTRVSDDAWQLGLQLWGERACDYHGEVKAALEHAGTAGLGDALGAVPFACRWQPSVATSLAEACDTPAPAQARVTFDSPCQSHARDLAALAGNTAHDLVQWALMDGGRSAELGKRGCDALADGARQAAAASLAGLDCRWLDHGGHNMGQRTSRSNGGRFGLKGFTGTVQLDGALAPAWPWLQLLALRGAGGRRGFGLGRVRLEGP